MTKAELIEKIAQEAGITKVAAEKALSAMTDALTGSLKKGGKVTLIGFGTFSVSERAARTGRNPLTGKALKIKASKVPRFKPGAGLKEAVNKKK